MFCATFLTLSCAVIASSYGVAGLLMKASVEAKGKNNPDWRLKTKALNSHPSVPLSLGNVYILDGKQQVKPRVTFSSSNNTYPSILRIEIPASTENYSLVLRKNEMSIAFNSICIDKHGKRISDTNSYGDCYYQGEVANHPTWMIIVSTCEGLRGYFGEMNSNGVFFHVAPLDETNSSLEADHMLYMDEKSEEGTCGCGEEIDFFQAFQESGHRIVQRQTTEQTRYIEWAMVNDNAQFNFNNKDLQRTVKRSLSIANGVNALYRPLNITVALVTVITFVDRDRFPVHSSHSVLFQNFLLYAHFILKNHISYDGIALLTGVDLAGSVAGTALIGTMCNRTYSPVLIQGGGIYSHKAVIAVAAHELGHSLNMNHDTGRSCVCDDSTGSCVMGASLRFPFPTAFSSCSVSDMNEYFNLGQDFCLFNAPTETVGDPQCGNGIVEENEECDCGSPLECAAVGVCCTSQCTLATYGTICRPSTGECDIAEYCLGDSSICPEDVGVANGVSCESGNGFCLDGRCPTHNSQCLAAFNSNASDCYFLNSRGDIYGFCEQSNTTFKPCNESDLLCGKLHCDQGIYTGIFGGILIATLPLENGVICKSASTNMSTASLSRLNLGTVADGTKCGDDMVCQSRTCVPRASIVACPHGLNNSECSGSRGVCNNRGACSCDVGYSGDACQSSRPTGENECQTDNGGCAQRCIETVNSFQCSCNEGFVLANDSRNCQDVNECSTANGGCPQVCTNVVGSFSCSCNPGFTLASDNISCINTDVNECLTGNGGCAQICTNSPGSFQCSCNQGFTLTADNLNCTNINECETSNGGCSQICTDIPGSFQCSCNPGFTLATDHLSCNNVNECLTGNGGCSQICTDTSGSFKCSCNVGYTLTVDGQGCDPNPEDITVTTPICQETSIKFQLRGNPVPTDRPLNISTIGVEDDALHCVTPFKDCCKHNRKGELYHIRSGEAFSLPKRGAKKALYRNRGPSLLRLNRRANYKVDTAELVGVYRCCLPDGCGAEKCIEITLEDPDYY